MTSIKNKMYILFSVFCVVIHTTQLFSSVPMKVYYQSVLKEKGQLVTGTRKMKFEVYNQPTGGSPIWSSGDVNVDVKNGIFRYVLDFSNSDIDFSYGPYYLQVSIEGTVLSPREEIVSTIYAIQAKTAEYAKKVKWSDIEGIPPGFADGEDNDTAGGSIGANTIGTYHIIDSTITSADIKDGEIVNADISDSANIAWTKINKTGSSLADLETRSPSALQSGELPNNVIASSISVNAVHTDAIRDNAVTNAKISSIDAGKITSGTLDDARLSVNVTKLGSTIGPGELDSGNYFNDVKVSSAIYADIAGSAVVGDNLGNHTATQDLDMGNHNITNVNLVDGYDVSAQFSEVATSTTTLEGNKLDKSSATVTYLYKNEKAADSDKLDGEDSSYFAVKAEVSASTTSLRTDIDAVAISTGTLVKKAGDTMTGVLNVSTISTVAQINFDDGTVMTSTATIADNLGNHTATQDLNLAGYYINNVSTISTSGEGIYLATNVFVTQGNVGIGTTNPAQKLQIQGSAAQVRVVNSDNNQEIFFGFPSTAGGEPALVTSVGGGGTGRIFQRQSIGDGPSNDVYIGDIDNNNGGVVFRSAGQNRIKITNTGNVGIGTTAPNQLLHVAGKIQVGNDAAAATAGTIRWTGTNFEGFDGSVWKTLDVQAPSGGGWTEDVAGNKVYVTNTGRNVGIGTTAPGHKLDVRGDAYFGADNSAVVIDNGVSKRTGFVKQAGKYTYLTAASGAPIVLAHSNATDLTSNVGAQTLTERLYIDSSGNVGIGTTGPGSKLSVSGGASVGSGYAETAAPADGMIIQGNVGIGTTSPGADDSKLDVAGPIRAGGWFDDPDKRIALTSPTGWPGIIAHDDLGHRGDIRRYADSWILAIHADTTIPPAVMVITESGNVGIGTTEPGAKLEVKQSGSEIYAVKVSSNDGSGMIVVQSNGNVGIGTTVLGYKLDVAGAVNATSGFYENGTKITNGSYWTLTGTNLYNNNSGNVGIGTTGPLGKLDIQGGADSTGANDPYAVLFQWRQGGYRHRITTRHNSEAGTGNAIDFYTWQPGQAVEDIGNKHGLTIENGNVGIGTTGPTSKLDVAGTAQLRGAAGGTGLYVNSSGNVGIGTTSPNAKLHAVETSGNNNYIFIVSTATDSGSYKMVVSTTGNVGIGTTSPAARLHVDNSAGFSGNLVIISTGADTLFRFDSNSNAYADGSWQGGGADYAEWFEKDSGEIINPGDIVGLNLSTGKARKYKEGDVLIGICSTNPGFVGNSNINKSEEELKQNCVLVGLVGQVDVNKAQVVTNGREVKTLDGKLVGYLLSNGKVLIKM